MMSAAPLHIFRHHGSVWLQIYLRSCLLPCEPYLGYTSARRGTRLLIHSQHRHLHVSNAALTRRTFLSRTHKQQSQRDISGLISTQHNLFRRLSDHRALGVFADPVGPPWYVLAPRS
jgi:hypothetical protein